MQNHLLKHDSNLSRSSSSSLNAGTPQPSRPSFRAVMLLDPRTCVTREEPYFQLAEPKLKTCPPGDATIKSDANGRGWNTANLTLLTLCAFYQLELNHVFFPKDILFTVLKRLEDLFRILSLTAEYRQGNASTTVSAVLRSLEGVEFVVYVWDNDDGQCILEVQRTCGPTDKYCEHGYAEKVMDVVQGIVDVPVVDPMDISIEETKQCQQDIDKVWNRYAPRDYKPSTEDVDSSFAIVLSLLRSTFFHHVGLGLESLLSMTDPNHSGLENATRCANEVLTGMFSEIIMFLLNDTTHGNLALQVLAQALNLADNHHAQITRKLVPFFMDMVQEAESSPHTAYLASHSLYITCKHCPDIQNEVRRPVIEKAMNFGKFGHAGLENSCVRLLGLLD